VGKLVLFLADGTTMDVPLDRERVTIGRRADNDVCLPYPAVSGEHAQVVTILADSFLEDLGSTNGTLVNGRGVTKHFLTDHDQIDIGRQRLTYLSDNDAKVDALPPDLLRNQLRGLSEKVEPARPLPQIDVPGGRERRPPSGVRNAPPAADFERDHGEPGPAPAMASAQVMPSAPTPARIPIREPERAAFAAVSPPRADTPVAVLARAAVPVLKSEKSAEKASGPPPTPPATPRGPSVRVLSGASTGRMVPFPNAEITVGRVGVQVAVVRKVPEGYRLIPLEGPQAPRINGAAVAPEGSPLHPGDTFEVAGVRLELSVDS
jgi:predicted component of type VI protein secretion system